MFSLDNKQVARLDNVTTVFEDQENVEEIEISSISEDLNENKKLSDFFSESSSRLEYIIETISVFSLIFFIFYGKKICKFIIFVCSTIKQVPSLASKSSAKTTTTSETQAQIESTSDQLKCDNCNRICKNKAGLTIHQKTCKPN